MPTVTTIHKASLNVLAARAEALRSFDQLPSDALVGYPELAVLTGRSADTLRQARRRGQLPLPNRGGSRRFLTRVGDVRAWLRGE